MNWFLYDSDFRHERLKGRNLCDEKLVRKKKNAEFKTPQSNSYKQVPQI